MALHQRRLVLVVAALAALQGGAYLVYRFVEGRRTDSSARAFAYERLAGPSVRQQAFETREGRPFTLATLGNRPLLLHFWATWCAPCRTELPTLLAGFPAADEATEPRLVLVSVDENWDTIRHYFGGDPPQQVVRDKTSRASQSLGVGTLPETFLVRADGTAVARVRGARNWQSAEAREAVAALLATAPP